MRRAILYSPGYGAGWTSWNRGDVAKLMLTYDPIVKALEAGESLLLKDASGKVLCKKYHPAVKQLIQEVMDMPGDTDACVLGVDYLKVMYVEGPVRIEEYDGYETVYTKELDECNWM